jgi:hypothetical protein
VSRAQKDSPRASTDSQTIAGGFFTGNSFHRQESEHGRSILPDQGRWESRGVKKPDRRLRAATAARSAQCRAVIRSLLYLLLRRVLGLFRSDDRKAAEAELEIAVLRHEVAIRRRQVKRPVYRTSDKAFLAAAGRLLPREAWGAFLVRPETLLRWHRRLVAKK